MYVFYSNIDYATVTSQGNINRAEKRLFAGIDRLAELKKGLPFTYDEFSEQSKRVNDLHNKLPKYLAI